MRRARAFYLMAIHETTVRNAHERIRMTCCVVGALALFHPPAVQSGALAGTTTEGRKKISFCRTRLRCLDYVAAGYTTSPLMNI